MGIVLELGNLFALMIMIRADSRMFFLQVGLFSGGLFLGGGAIFSSFLPIALGNFRLD